MGRYYRTATPTFATDLISEWDTSLMEKALKTHDDALEKANVEGDELGKLLGTVNNLQDDNEAVNASKADFNNRITSLSDQIANDPANYQKYAGQVRDISRELNQSLDNGLFKRAQENVTQKDKILTEATASGANKNTVENFGKSIAKDYQEQGGLGYQDPDNYNQYQGDTEYTQLYKQFDEAGFIGKLTQTFTADQTANAYAGGKGGYIRSGSGTNKFVTEDDVDAWMDDYFVSTDWDNVTRQEIYYDLRANSDFRGKKDDPVVEQALANRRAAFKSQAKNQIAFSQKTKSASAHADGAYQYEQNRLDAKNVKPTSEEYVNRADQTETTAANFSVSNFVIGKVDGINNQADFDKKMKEFNGDVTALGVYLNDNMDIPKPKNMSQEDYPAYKLDKVRELGDFLQKNKVISNELIPYPTNSDGTTTTDPYLVNKWSDDNKEVENRVKNVNINQPTRVTFTAANGVEQDLGDGRSTIGEAINSGALGAINVNAGQVQMQVGEEFGEPIMKTVDVYDNTAMIENGTVYLEEDATGERVYSVRMYFASEEGPVEVKRYINEEDVSLDKTIHTENN
jgi:hypothetical protein